MNLQRGDLIRLNNLRVWEVCGVLLDRVYIGIPGRESWGRSYRRVHARHVTSVLQGKEWVTHVLRDGGGR